MRKKVNLVQINGEKYSVAETNLPTQRSFNGRFLVYTCLYILFGTVIKTHFVYYTKKDKYIPLIHRIVADFIRWRGRHLFSATLFINVTTLVCPIR